MAATIDMDYFAAVFEKNMKAMYEEAKNLCDVSGDDFPEGIGVIILTEDPANYDKYDTDAYEFVEQTMHLSDEEPQSSDDETKENGVLKYHEMTSQTSQQQAEDDMIARALRQLAEAKDKAADVVVDEITFPNSSVHGKQLASELVDHLQHSTFGVQMAIDELGDSTQKLSKDKELPYENVQQRTDD